MLHYVLIASLAAPCLVACVLTVRLLSTLRRVRSRRKDLCSKTKLGKSPFPSTNCKLMVVLGSGGHTAEMLTLVTDILTHTTAPTQIVYITGDTDTHSAQKAAALHANARGDAIQPAKTLFKRLPRAREVGQRWLSSAFATARTLSAAFRVVWRERPHLVLCNGPGTSAVVAGVAFFLRAVTGARWGRVVYVESFARVETLSLSGKLVYAFADRFIVQWPTLQKRYPMAEYHGRLV